MSARNLAVVAHAAGDLRVEVIPEPTPAPDEAVLDVRFGGVCGSDLHYWTHGAAGASILREPMVLGHEVVARVAVPAADGSGPPIGALVAVHPGTPRGDGTPYPSDRPNLAPAGTYLGSAAHLPHTAGAFARRVALPTRMLRVVPDGVDERTAALAEPAAVAWHGVGRAGADAVRGRRVLVVGVGPIGALTIAVLRHHGAAEIIATDLHPAPLDLAHRLGATATLDARDADAIGAVAADVVVESSGSVPGLASAISGAVRGGTVVLLGLQRAGEVPATLATAISRELTLTGSFRFNDEIDDVLAAFGDGSLDVDGVVTHEFAVGDALAAFEAASDPATSSKVLLRFGDD